MKTTKQKTDKPALAATPGEQDLDQILAMIAAERADVWSQSSAGAPYDNTPIRELAQRRIEEAKRVR